MKVISPAPKKILKDMDQVIKKGTGLEWEAHILKAIDHIAGVPHVRGFGAVMGDDTGELRSLVMDEMPGVPLSVHRPTVSDEQILSQLYTILVNIYAAGVAHMRILPENVMCTDKGLVSLVGFSQAVLIEPNPMVRFRASPDMTGRVDGFVITGPNKEVSGSYKEVADFLGKS